jgi:hypothetical protein
LLLLSVSSAFAQPAPKLNSISPEWIQRGTTVQIVFSGENLGNVTGFIFSGVSGLTASNVPPPAPPKPALTIESDLGGISIADPKSTKDDKRLVATVTAASDAPLAVGEVRVITPTGVSNPLTINVGHLPEVSEKEPDNSVEQAQMISLPAAISGVISAAAQVDYYRFKASKGQELVFEVDAWTHGSDLSFPKTGNTSRRFVIFVIRAAATTLIGSMPVLCLTWNRFSRLADSAASRWRWR